MVILIISTTRRDRNHPACLTDGGNEVKKKKLVSDLPKDVFGFKSLSSVRDGERGFS